MRRRRWLIAGALMAASAATVYAVSPLHAIWELHRAIKSADAATVARRVDWPRVRVSLRQSIAFQARLTPVSDGTATTASRGRITLWDRLKSHFGGRLLDRFIERYITPQGLIDLDQARNHGKAAFVRAGLSGRGLQPGRADLAAAPAKRWWDKARDLLGRVRSAGFCSLTCFSVRIADRKVATRSFRAQFELVGTTWMMTRVDVMGEDEDYPAIAQQG